MFNQTFILCMCVRGGSVKCISYCVLVTQSCPTLCDPTDCSPPGSSVRGILQVRILEWIAMSFSRGSSRLRDRTQVFGITGRFFTVWATWEWFFVTEGYSQKKKKIQTPLIHTTILVVSGDLWLDLPGQQKLWPVANTSFVYERQSYFTSRRKFIDALLEEKYKIKGCSKISIPVQWGISCVFATLSELCWRKEEANLQCLPRERKVVTRHHHFLPAWVEDGGWSLKGGTVTSSMEPDSGQTFLCPPLLRRTVCQCSASRDLWNSLRGRCLTIRAWATNMSFVTLMFSPGGGHGNPL